MNDLRVPIRLVFADRGSFHDVLVELPEDVLSRYERLIDALREDAVITRELFVDTRRLVAAYRTGDAV
jgi:secreted protein with Ig-like and vWFA domain